MIEQTARQVFFVCLYPCATLVLFFIWNGGPASRVWFQLAASLFVIGLAAFLTWFTFCMSRAIQDHSVFKNSK